MTAPPVPPVTRVAALLSWLLDTACEELAATPNGPVGARLISPSSTSPPADWCCQTRDGLGMAWVRVTRRYRSVVFPAPDATPSGGCSASVLAVECELGAYRCVAVTDDHGNPPAAAAVTADALGADADACALARAVARLNWTHVRGAWTPLGPSGGCGGGAQLLAVAIGTGPIGQ